MEVQYLHTSKLPYPNSASGFGIVGIGHFRFGNILSILQEWNQHNSDLACAEALDGREIGGPGGYEAWAAHEDYAARQWCL